MSLKNTAQKYGSVTKYLHWIITLAIVTQLFLVWSREFITNKSLSIEFILLHKSLGMVILMLVILFLCWHLMNRKPAYPVKMARWEKIAAHSIQGVMMLLLLAMPITGWMMATAASKNVNLFGMGIIPMPGIPVSSSLAGFVKDLHETLAWVLVGAIVIHIGAALKHHFIDKNDVLRKML